jgi:(p)ppGpp synthase/HD superfamily hydrolase
MIKITSKQLEEAIIFATEKHGGQVRKGDGRPYILHPMSVLMRCYKAKSSKNMFLLMTACILHDTVEDCGVKLDEIASKFGYHVAALVEELTLDKTKYEIIGKKEYLAEEMVGMSSYALFIKLCDRLDNISDCVSMSNEFVIKYVAETAYILDKVKKGRKLTKSHLILISEIEKQLEEL